MNFWKSKKTDYFLLIFSFVVLHVFVIEALCPEPDVQLNSRVTLTSDDLTSGTTAKYVCDPGFVRLGDDSRLCQSDDTWSGEAPSCATNVAQDKPSNQSTTARGGEAANGNDGDVSTLHDGSRCTQTLQQTSPWWMVDLLDEYPIDMIRVTTRGCCGQKPLQNIEIRVGSNRAHQFNRLCAWYPGTMPEGQSHDFRCAQPLSGRYVFVQMVGEESTLSLCEVQVFSSEEFAKQQCARDVPLSSLSLFGKHCYQIQVDRGANFSQARQYCQRHGGDLVHATSERTHQFLLRQLQALDNLRTQLFWIGVEKKARDWRWIDGSLVKDPRWGRDQPNSYVGEQNCVVADGGRGWKWNDVSCLLNYLYWICQYTPQVCGSPDKRIGTSIEGSDFRVNSSVVYKCPEGNKVVAGDEVRTCLSTGLWSGTAPACKYFDCGAPDSVEHGETQLLDKRTTYGARVQYTCGVNYTLVGSAVATCDEGTWTDKPPQCMFSTCPTPVSPLNATVQVRGNLSEGSEALFSCSAGHRLIGEPVLRCLLGGTWNAPRPLCQLIECGAPTPLVDGNILLNATYYGAVARFQCDEDFVLRGDEQRVCQEDGRWSGSEPTCEAISCGNPEVPDGSYVTGYDFRVHSVVEYHCNEGHVLEGAVNRTCQSDTTWSNDVPYCRYVNCGRVPVIRHGKIQYLSSATHLGAQVEYSCVTNFRLVGKSRRTCLASGLWSDSTPECEEVRCQKPEIPQKAAISVSRNDQMRQKARQIMNNLPPVETYRVGATVTYSCEPGHKVEGAALRTCRNNGGWSGLPPTCLYVDCGAPDSLVNGSVTLATRATHYGAIAEYKCTSGYRAKGLSRRICLGDGEWSATPPECVEVFCERPQHAGGVLLSVVRGLRVGDTVSYSCGTGRQLLGDAVHQCLASGQWNSTLPTCHWVDCGEVDAVENGRVYYVNESTVYGSLVEYNCFDQYLRHGPFTRRCRHDGTWSGPNTKCISIDEAVNTDLENELGTAAGFGPTRGDSVRYTLMWTGVIVGMFVVIALIAVVVCLRMRYQVVKNNENVQGMKALEERSVPIMSFNSLNGGPRFSRQMQSRPLPLRPGDEADDIYAEADSFSSEEDGLSPPLTDDQDVADSAASEHAAASTDDRTYANSSVTYSERGGAGYTDSENSSASGATRSGADSAATNITSSTVTVNGVAL